MRAIHIIKWGDIWPFVAVIVMQLFLNIQLFRMMEQARSNEREMSLRLYKAIRGYNPVNTNTYAPK